MPQRSGEHNGIGTLNEKSLHAALKEWYAQPGDRLEVAVDGYVVDIVRGDLLIEIQTRNFSAAKAKLGDLASRHAVRLVYPIASEKWLVKLPREGTGQAARRKSPKRGRIEDLFTELVSVAPMLRESILSLEVVFTREEEIRRHDGKRGWRRRGWVTEERRLLEVVGQRRFDDPGDFGALVPCTLPQPFTTADLAQALRRPRRLAQRMAYCLREMGEIQPAGRRGRAVLYSRRGETLVGQESSARGVGER